jgi:hypothetical protein
MSEWCEVCLKIHGDGCPASYRDDTGKKVCVWCQDRALCPVQKRILAKAAAADGVAAPAITRRIFIEPATEEDARASRIELTTSFLRQSRARARPTVTESLPLPEKVAGVEGTATANSDGGAGEKECGKITPPIAAIETSVSIAAAVARRNVLYQPPPGWRPRPVAASPRARITGTETIEVEEEEAEMEKTATTVRICSVEGCTNKLANNNRSGKCQARHGYGNQARPAPPPAHSQPTNGHAGNGHAGGNGHAHPHVNGHDLALEERVSMVMEKIPLSERLSFISRWLSGQC